MAIFLLPKSLSGSLVTHEDWNMVHLIDYAKSFVGTPYIWGGDDSIKGYDCSGVVQEILASAGQDPPGDQTSQGLYDYYETNGRYGMHGPEFAGALVFYGKNSKNITHVAFAIDQYRMIEAGGGGKHVKTVEDAIKYNAFIRMRLIREKNRVAIIKPHYRHIGGYW